MALITKNDIENIQVDLKSKRDLQEKIQKVFDETAEDLDNKIESNRKVKEKYAKVEADYFLVSKDARKAVLILEESAYNLQKAEEKLEEAVKSIKDAEEAKKENEDKRYKLKSDIDDLTTTLEDIKKDIEAKNEKLDDITSFLAEEEDKLAGIEPGTEEYAEKQKKINDLKEKKEVETRERDGAVEEKDRIEAELEGKPEELKEAEAAAPVLDKAIDDARTRADEADKKREEFEEARERAGEDKENLEQREEDIKSELASTEEELRVTEKELLGIQENYDQVKADLKGVQAEIAELESGALITKYEEQEAERAEAFKDSIPNIARIQPVLYGKIDEDESREADSDNRVLQQSIIDDVFGFDEGNDAVFQKNMKLIREKFESTHGPRAALEAAQSSMFEVETILKTIMDLASKGETSLQVSGAKINGLQIIALIQLGYNVTHRKVKAGRNQPDIDFIIDWSFGDSGKS